MQWACLAEQGSSLLLGRQPHRPGQQPLQLLACHAREPLCAQRIRIPLQSLLLCTRDTASAQGMTHALRAGCLFAPGSTCCICPQVMVEPQSVRAGHLHLALLDRHCFSSRQHLWTARSGPALPAKHALTLCKPMGEDYPCKALQTLA